MKLLIFCNKCVFESDYENYNYEYLDISDEGVYELICSKGHKTITLLQEEKFEILFEMGAMALLDGYCREAVSSFAASLERFYEYFIQVLMTHKNIPYEEVNKSWKMVKNQSERQLGAFYFLYLNEFKEAPPILSRKIIEFRNNVIHKGKIPKYDEVISYATELYRYMVSILTIVKENYSDTIGSLIFQRQENFRRNYPEGVTYSVSSMPTIIYLASENSIFKKQTFQEGLSELEKRINVRGFYSK